MSIHLGQITIVKENYVGVISVIMDNLFSDTDKSIVIEYFIGDSSSPGNRNKIILRGKEMNDFYTSWDSGLSIYNLIFKQQNIAQLPTREDADKDFVNVVAVDLSGASSGGTTVVP